MPRPKVHIDLLQSLRMVSAFRKAKRLNADVTLREFSRTADPVVPTRYFERALDVIEAVYGFRFVVVSLKKRGRTDVVAEADPILDRFDAAFDAFLDSSQKKTRACLTRVGSWGVAAETGLLPALGALARSAAGDAPAVRPVVHRSMEAAFQGLIDFKVDALLSVRDAGADRDEFRNITDFHPGTAEARAVRVSRGGSDLASAGPVLFTRGFPSQWTRRLPRIEPRRGDLMVVSALAAIQTVAAGYGASVILGTPVVLRRAGELGLIAESVEHLSTEPIGVYTRKPRERMVSDVVWGKVERLLRACSEL